MQSTGVLNLGIGLTGVKEKCGVHMSYMYLARAAAFSFLCFTHVRLEPPPRPHSPIPHRRSSTQPPPLCTHAPRAARHLRRRPTAAAARSLCHRRSHSAHACPRRTCTTAAYAARTQRRHSPTVCMPTPTLPRLHAFHAAAAAAQRSPSVRRFA